MKRIFLMLAAVVALVSCGSNTNATKTEIYGAIDNLESIGNVYLVDMWDARNVIDSVKIENTKPHHPLAEAVVFGHADVVLHELPYQLIICHIHFFLERLLIFLFLGRCAI